MTGVAEQKQAAPDGDPLDCPVCGAPLPVVPDLRGPDRLHGVPGEFTVRVCRSCGAGLTLPLAQSSALAAYYPDEYVAYEAPPRALHAALSVLYRLRDRRWLRTLPLSALASLTPGRALDVGCGRGDLGELLIGRGWRVTGVEPSREAGEQAARRGLDVRTGVIETVELEREAYDVAIFRHALEHVADPLADLGRVHSALVPGGLVLITLPNFSSWQRSIFGSAWFSLELPRHRVHFGALALATALERAGFELLETATTTSLGVLPETLEHRLFGRSLFSHGLGWQLSLLAYAALYPLGWITDRVAGNGDCLHAVARKRPPSVGA